jgi:hypothetical protein
MRCGSVGGGCINLLLSGITIIFIGTIVFPALPQSLQQEQTASTNSQSSSNFNVSDNTGDSIYPSVAASNNNVYVVWQDAYGGQNVSYYRQNNDIFFKRSTDGGRSFENITKLSNSTTLSARPIIAAFDNNVYVVWNEDTPKEKQIWFRKSTDNGSSFDRPINLGNNSYSRDNILPKAIAAFGDHVYVVWRQLTEDGNQSSIFLKGSIDTGNTFGEAKEVSENALYRSSPKVAAFNNNVYVVWDVKYSNSGGYKGTKNEGIFFAKSSDDGVTFDKQTKLNGVNDFGEAQVAAYFNDVYVAWAGSVYYPDNSTDNIFLTSSFDNGDTFEKTILLNNGITQSANVELAKTERRIEAVWQDGVTSNGEIFHKSSSNVKPALIDPARNLSDTEGASECPSIAISGKTTYVVWEDSTYGNHEIFLKKLVSN